MGPATSFTDGWQQTGSLLALRETIDAGGRLRHAIARRAGLAESDLVAMEHLMRGPLGPAELARILDVSSAAATGVVDRLAGRGHVERRAHEEDRRRTQVEVTGSGREEVLALLVPMFGSLGELDSSFTEEERAIVERYLRGALKVFDDLEADPWRDPDPDPDPEPPPSEA